MNNTCIEENLKFKFYFVKNNYVTSIFKYKGTADREKFILDKEEIPYNQIDLSIVKNKRMLLLLNPQYNPPKLISASMGQPGIIVLEIAPFQLKRLRDHINRRISEISFNTHRNSLEAQGKSDLVRKETCPSCSALVNLSGLEKSNYIYCAYCETIFRSPGEVVSVGDDYHQCEECKLFGRIKVYTEFYFYFLLVVYGFSMKSRYLCENCAASLFWKVFLWNFIFILGLFPALWLKIKSITGADSKMASLSRGNAFSAKGNYRVAERFYSDIYLHYPDHPGVKTNEAMGHLKGGDSSGAMDCFNKALKSCPNYYPATRLLKSIGNPGQ